MGLIKIEIVCKFGTLKFEMNDYKNKEAFYFLLVNHIKIHYHKRVSNVEHITGPTDCSRLWPSCVYRVES